MPDKIKVLHVIGKRPRGGVGTFLINMHSNIDTSKVEFDYLINANKNEDGDFDKIVRNLGGNVFVLPELKYQNTFKYLKDMRDFFSQNNNYQVIHLHTANIGIFTFAMALKFKIKYRILHSHNTKYSDKKINSIRNFVMQLPVKKMANIYFACSEKAGSFLFGKKNFDDGKVYIAKNAINANNFRYDEDKRLKVRTKLGFTDKIVLGHIGRFNIQKNHEFLIEVFKKAYEKNNQCVLVLVGDGELEEYIKEKVEKLNLQGSVFFLGNRKDVPDLLQAFDVFIMPSFFEGLPLVGIEVQAAGLPCIMSDSITDELKIIDTVEFISLEKDPQYWADRVLCKMNDIRKDTYESIVNAGYDSKKAASDLGDYYTKLSKS
ncbi:glycosyltransferase family 1 protein [Paenibacillus sp. FSL R7-0163]|uniref:glycosyltransferase family 1 protein n=1 Tax=Paenibacillus sp. FSL R7-0163 TaxID=2954530 RepID=UPI0030DB8A3D